MLVGRLKQNRLSAKFFVLLPTFEPLRGRVVRGRALASSSIDGTVVIWNLATGQPSAVLEGHKAYVVDHV
jgi:WD40 repeat protein